MDLKHLTFLVLAYTVVGTVASLALIKPSEVGRRFFLYHGLGAVVLGVATLLLLGSGIPPKAFTCFGLFLVFAGVYSYSVEKFPAVSHLTYGLSVVMGIFAIYYETLGRFTIEAALVSPLWGFVVNAILSSLLLGVTLIAMLLGHWYLQTPRLSIDELKRVTLVLIALAVIRMLVGTYFSYRLIALDPGGDALRYLIATTPGLFTLMRWTWGLLFPIILLAMVWGTVRIRSTQSATGILYVAVLAVITGEILGIYLTLSQGVPL